MARWHSCPDWWLSLSASLWQDSDFSRPNRAFLFPPQSILIQFCPALLPLLPPSSFLQRWLLPIRIVLWQPPLLESMRFQCSSLPHQSHGIPLEQYWWPTRHLHHHQSWTQIPSSFLYHLVHQQRLPLITQCQHQVDLSRKSRDPVLLHIPKYHHFLAQLVLYQRWLLRLLRWL